jgi:hypothetical protein
MDIGYFNIVPNNDSAFGSNQAQSNEPFHRPLFYSYNNHIPGSLIDADYLYMEILAAKW